MVAACTADPGRPPEPTPSPPPTEWDPPPWSPPAVDDAHTGDTVGAMATGGIDQPRWVLLRFLQAVRDADEATLQRLLTDPVLSRRLRERPRGFWIDRLTRGPRRRGLDAEVPLEALVSVRRVEVLSAHRWSMRPRGVLDTDLWVSFPLEPKGRRMLSPLLLWRDHGQIIVRPGPDPRIVGL